MRSAFSFFLFPPWKEVKCLRKLFSIFILFNTFFFCFYLNLNSDMNFNM